MAVKFVITVPALMTAAIALTAIQRLEFFSKASDSALVKIDIRERSRRRSCRLKSEVLLDEAFGLGQFTASVRSDFWNTFIVMAGPGRFMSDDLGDLARTGPNTISNFILPAHKSSRRDRAGSTCNSVTSPPVA